MDAPAGEVMGSSQDPAVRPAQAEEKVLGNRAQSLQHHCLAHPLTSLLQNVRP